MITMIKGVEIYSLLDRHTHSTLYGQDPLSRCPKVLLKVRQVRKIAPL